VLDVQIVYVWRDGMKSCPRGKPANEMLHALSFRIARLYGSTTVEPVINNVPLSKLVSAFEIENGFDPAGGYGGLLPDGFCYGPLDAYFLGRAEADYWTYLRGIYFLGCGGCGEVGCWPLVGKVEVAVDRVVWNEFSQPHRPQRDYSRFGPFVFAREQYASALADLLAKLNAVQSGRGKP
jgi:hypothetical protein